MHTIPSYNASFSLMYALPIDELKKRYSGTCINRAITIWANKFTEDQISEKIDELDCFLQRASKGEFINTYKYYVTKT